jgi:hypothetical protein
MTAHHGFHCDPDTDICYRDLTSLGFPGYRVGDDGSVWSRHNNRHGLLDYWWKMNTPYIQYGVSVYHQVELRVNGKRFARKVHILVMLAFVGPRPANLDTQHINGIGIDNWLGNLTYGTARPMRPIKNYTGGTTRGNGTVRPSTPNKPFGKFDPITLPETTPNWSWPKNTTSAGRTYLLSPAGSSGNTSINLDQTS